MNSKNGRKFYYSQKLCFDKFFAWKEYIFLSGFLTNTILNFCQECSLMMSYFRGGWRVWNDNPKIGHLQNKNIPKNYPELEIWICCLLLLAGNLNFKFRIAFWNIFIFEIGRFKKHIALSEKKPPLISDQTCYR